MTQTFNTNDVTPVTASAGEPTLSLDYTDILEEVGNVLGFGRDSSSYTDAQTAEADVVVQRGYRQWLSPPAVMRNNKQYAHTWRFLSPFATISVLAPPSGSATGAYSGGFTTVTATTEIFLSTHVGMWLTIAGLGTYKISTYTSTTEVIVTGGSTFATAAGVRVEPIYALPANFGLIVGQPTYHSSDVPYTMQVVSEGQLRSGDWPGMSGRPLLCAVRARPFEGGTGQRYELIVWPRPDATFVLTYTYSAQLNKLSTSNPYPLGGPQHSESIMQSCLDVAERYKSGSEGPEHKAWLARLAASVELDLKTVASSLGYNADRSDGRRTKIGQDYSVTYNDVLYSG